MQKVKRGDTMQGLKIITLMEDNLCGEGLVSEHGLSVYIETKKHKLLVDTGQSDKTLQNAAVMGVDLTQVDTVVLSHGHYDHSGGLLAFAAINPTADIYMRECADGEYYAFKEGAERYIGIDKAISKLPKLHLTKGDVVIDEELSLFTDIEAVRPIPRGNSRLHERQGEEYVQDSFAHEQYLVIQYEAGRYALISGCAHKGILNIIDAFHKLYHKDPDIVVSGFHMVLPEYTEADLAEIRAAAEELAGMDTEFYTGHCTGDVAMSILKETLGPKLWSLGDGVKGSK